MSTKFTPGPWGKELTPDNIWIGPMRPDGKVSEVVVRLACDRDYTPSYLARQGANAHLIAAAPELYEALEALVATDPEGESSQWKAARAALARACGEQVPA